MQEKGNGVMISLEGKNAIVTGGGGGMGRCTALTLAAAGANLLVSDVNAEAAESVAREAVEQDGVKAVAIKCDVTVKSEVDAMVELAVKTFGRIDILNHVAGVFGAVDFMQSTEADYDKQMNINAKGTYLVDQAVLRIMIPNRAGKIVNMCSQAGKYGFHTNVAYTSSKFAVAGMTQSIAQYAAPYNINVNCVCPGVVRTNIWERALDDIRRQGGDAEAYFQSRLQDIPLKRAQTMEDVAHMFLYLSSDFADNMTGQSINITGGKIMH